ncbi:MAG: M15 family metallopeptidase [Cytophagales bacterium]|nr:M15 family metallopeptidase [Cytophagales bacterium]
MRHIQIFSSWLIAFLFAYHSYSQSGREHFVNVKEEIPTISLDIRYFSQDNFVGARIDGYKTPIALITKDAGKALKNIQAELARENLGLKIFDAYRPQKGVNHFVRWAKVSSDTLTKSTYYPNTKKANVFKLGYVASKSGHSRGSTVDLTVVDLSTGDEIDMGSGWDFFGEISWHATNEITDDQKANRSILKTLMAKHGFKSYSKEWWHYTLRKEPFPETYFDFNVE